MRPLNLSSALAALGLLVLTGCGRSQGPVSHQTEYHGVKVDWGKLQSTFMESDQDVRMAADGAKRSIVYRRFPQALMALESLASNPKLTAEQKQVVNDTMAQVKQAAEQTAPPPQEQH